MDSGTYMYYTRTSITILFCFPPLSPPQAQLFRYEERRNEAQTDGGTYMYYTCTSITLLIYFPPLSAI